MAYMYTGAFPQYYDQPKWDLDTQYSSTIAAPGFSVIGGYGDSAMATLNNNSWSSCTFPTGEQCATNAWPRFALPLSLDWYGNKMGQYIFNASVDSSIAFTDPWNDLVLQVPVKCK